MENLREEYEKETGKRWFTNTVSHGEIAFASWDYQRWLEEKASHVSDTMRLLPSVDDMWTECEKEIKEAGGKPIGAFSVMKPSNFYRTGFTHCWVWLTEYIKARQ